jgi:hypothetical protein
MNNLLSLSLRPSEIKQKLRVKLVEHLIKQTPSISIQNDSYPVEIHSAINHIYTPTMIYVIKVFLKAIDMNLPVVLHDDGTLTIQDIHLIKSHIKGITILPYFKTLNRLITKYNLVKKYPNCYALKMCLRNTNRLNGIRIIDIPLLAKTRKILLLDSDVIFYSKPEYIVNWIKNPHDKSMFFMEDQGNWYSLPLSDLKRLNRKQDVVQNVNCGLVGLNVEKMSIDIIEKWLGQMFKMFDQKRIPNDKRIYIDQDIMTLYFGLNSPLVYKLPDDYFLIAREAWNAVLSPKHPVCIHYSGPFKENLYHDILFNFLNRKRNNQFR